MLSTAQPTLHVGVAPSPYIDLFLQIKAFVVPTFTQVVRRCNALGNALFIFSVLVDFDQRCTEDDCEVAKSSEPVPKVREEKLTYKFCCFHVFIVLMPCGVSFILQVAIRRGFTALCVL